MVRPQTRMFQLGKGVSKCPNISSEGVDSKQLTEKVFGRERTFDDLMSNVEYIQKDAERMHQFRALWSTMEAYLGREWLPAPDAGLEIFGKMVINSYSICDEDNYPIGSGLYIGPSLLDHSCAPNAQAVFDGRKLILRAVADIDCDSIGGIRVCYVDVLDLRTERARILREQYYFDCGCGRCIRDQVAEYLTEKSPALTARVKLLWEELKKLGIPSDDGYARSRKEAERLLEANLLPESDVARIRALELASWCCIKQGDYEAALGHLAARVEPYRKCYGDRHPAYGALLFAIAKIHHLAGRFREAEDYFEKATKVVIVTHGQRHPHFRNLAEALHHCRMEMAATES